MSRQSVLKLQIQWANYYLKGQKEIYSHSVSHPTERTLSQYFVTRTSFMFIISMIGFVNRQILKAGVYSKMIESK